MAAAAGGPGGVRRGARPARARRSRSVEGFALGGGLEIALSCDLVVAGDAAVVGLPEVSRRRHPRRRRHPAADPPGRLVAGGRDDLHRAPDARRRGRRARGRRRGRRRRRPRATGRWRSPPRSRPTRRSGCATPSGRCGSGPTSTSPPGSRSRTPAGARRRSPATGTRGSPPLPRSVVPAWPGRGERGRPVYDALMTRVLLAEDDPAISEPLARALRREGYDVDVRDDGPAALEGAEREPRPRGPRPRAAAASTASRCAGGSAPTGSDHPRADPDRARRRGRHGGRAWTPAPTTTSPSRSGWPSCWPGCGRCCAARPNDAGADQRASCGSTPRGGGPASTSEELQLTAKEFDLLRVLVREQGKVVSREQLMREIWDTAWFGSTKTLDMHISGPAPEARATTPPSPRYIATVRGVGFRFERGDTGLTAGAPAVWSRVHRRSRWSCRRHHRRACRSFLGVAVVCRREPTTAQVTAWVWFDLPSRHSRARSCWSSAAIVVPVGGAPSACGVRASPLRAGARAFAEPMTGLRRARRSASAPASRASSRCAPASPRSTRSRTCSPAAPSS